MSKQNITDFYGRILGTLEELSNGNVIARDFYGKILGEYDKALNVTKDFYGRILARGNITSSLIYNAKK